MPAATPGTPSLLRAMNDRAALDLLLTHGPLSRTRIGHLTGLSKPTASQLLARLEAAGLVVATGTDGGRPGPSAQLYAINPRAAYVGGVDVTPGRVLAAVADLTGTVVASHEVPYTEGADAVDQVTEALGGAVKAAGLHRSDLHRAVIGTPGAFDPQTGRLRYASHLPGWHSPTLLDDLAAALPMPVEYENDVNLAAVAEQRLGAARGHGDFVLLWNEEGLGAALVFGGRLHRGWTGGAGEVGFLPVPGRPLVRQVTRANSGGYQELAGVEGLPRLAAELGVEAPAAPTPYAPEAPDALPGPHGPEVAAAVALLARAAAAPEGAHLCFLQEYATALATGLASLVAVLDPEIVVLAGAAISAGGEPLRELLEAELAELAPSRPRLVPGEVLERPVLHGALESALAATRDEVFDTSR
ncbi:MULTISPECIES: ROK family transcriptional regulator [Streptomyces]|uniref:ROK family transcriptional regulator n=1 Tax=Streptomyces TaxID=1883 RepID=UPI0006AFA8E5|nr:MULTISPECIES: ROK family transcriptional regulator [unclassified Streptomyces]KOU68768.1 ROK family transcriptional regulator [Streptomyces sp. IGB124]KOU84736.1 ROK family transcriptional regulator [Streptomyces sp. XY58]KOV04928.1 ROK family transcriptional regulator [Streptomyces sp. XY37]KOV47073.1 ROK family transcriptional regulator [Streptomyces sp. MMG1064]